MNKSLRYDGITPHSLVKAITDLNIYHFASAQSTTLETDLFREPCRVLTLPQSADDEIVVSSAYRSTSAELTWSGKSLMNEGNKPVIVVVENVNPLNPKMKI